MIPSVPNIQPGDAPSKTDPESYRIQYGKNHNSTGCTIY